jgi:DNA-binding transcriptional LysR family regulator
VLRTQQCAALSSVSCLQINNRLVKYLPEMVVFAAVVEQRGFAAAARQLDMTASAVSRSVARLEAHLGLKLLNRTTRSLSLTEAGTEIYGQCARIAQAARDVEAQAGRDARKPTGVVRVSAPTVFGEIWLAPRLPGFIARWPEVQVDLTLIDRVVDLAEEGFDLAIRLTLPEALSPGLVARPLFGMSYVMVATPSYLASAGVPSSPGQLCDHRCLYLGYGGFRDRLEMSREGEQASVQVGGPLTINSSLAILTAVEADVGIGIVPDFVAADGLDAGRLERVLPAWSLGGAYAARTAHAVYCPTRYLPQKVRVLIDHLVATA